LIDAFGRKIEYLRISLTDKCNLRCGYCMPKEGIKCIEHDMVLKLEEILRAVKIFSDTGIKKIRFTGGEPFVRKNVLWLFKEIHSYNPEIEMYITTNGILLNDIVLNNANKDDTKGISKDNTVILRQNLRDLRAAGIKGLNVSLDALDSDIYKTITGFDGLEKTVATINEAYNAGLKVKVNAVLMKGINDSRENILSLVNLAKDKEIDVRFIELMPIGPGREFRRVSGDDVLKLLESNYENITEKNCDSEIKGPSNNVKFKGFKGNVGFINPISHKFCEYCNRVRFTSEGKLKLCLYYKDGLELRDILRDSSVNDDIIKDMIIKTVMNKPAKHSFSFSKEAENPETKRMFEIGG